MARCIALLVVLLLGALPGCEGELRSRDRVDGGGDASSRIDGSAPGVDAGPGRDAAPGSDAAMPSVDAGADAVAPPAPDAGPPDCSHSASGSTSIWTCTPDRLARQRCVGGLTETDACAHGPCVSMPTGVDDVCPSDPTTSNASTYCPGGACVHWWNCRITYQYQYTSGNWDTDYHMADGTPIALPHRSQLTAVYTAGSGFQPEFADLDSGEWIHFNHLHLNSEFGGSDTALGPVQLVSLSDPDHPDHIYPAGWVVGFSGGGTTRTGYMGTDASGSVCSGGHSTAAHFCAVTRPTHPIDYYLPDDGGGCSAPLGWPSALWASISGRAPGYETCPSVCTRCGVPHF